eukprot:867640-Lingulodinium_polyedra.AAC.1
MPGQTVRVSAVVVLRRVMGAARPVGSCVLLPRRGAVVAAGLCCELGMSAQCHGDSVARQLLLRR